MSSSIYLIGTMVLVLFGPVAMGQTATVESLWQQADRLQSQSDYQAAADAFREVIERFPNSPKVSEAATRAGLCLEKAEQTSAAIEAYDRAITLRSNVYWLQVALFYKSAACLRENRQDDARQAIQQLRAEFPDSSQAVRAGIVEADLLGQDRQAAEERWLREVEATKLFNQAHQADKQNDSQAALQLLEQVVTSYPDTAAALRAWQAKGHLLLRTGNRNEAFAAFAAILTGVGESAPQSAIVQTTKTRLAALLHASGNREDALAIYREVLSGFSPGLRSRAALQIAGLEFEVLQRERYAQKPISAEQWQRIRDLCTGVMEGETAKPAERARAHLMLVETFSWQRDPQAAVSEAERFLGQYEGNEFKQDVATVRLIAGEALQRLGRFDEALTHFRWIIEAYRGQKEIWPGMDHLPRTYFQIRETLKRSWAPAAQIREVEDELLKAFPESCYARAVRQIRRIKGEPDAK